MCYITHRDRLLVFDQPGSQFPGFQVTAGSLEADETPEAGALREAREETGLTRIAPSRFLGESQRDMRDFTRQEIHHRFYFHLLCEEETPEVWSHMEPSPSDTKFPLLPFSFRWVRMPNEVPPLIADLGYYLPALYEGLQTKDRT